ncbi:hypothetical protein ABZ904_25785 [Streptomyces sp. NPDC046900]|uniref:hypothetical protein n=1 Tax=Streptomyces sp. NPDC046900 TaxID=3155473 RepID=UPI0033E225FE
MAAEGAGPQDGGGCGSRAGRPGDRPGHSLDRHGSARLRRPGQRRDGAGGRHLYHHRPHRTQGHCHTDPSATDSTASTGLTFTVIPVAQPSLTIAKRHAGSFTRGEDGVYTITVGNVTAAGPTNGTTVTVHDILPAGLRAARITGEGWHCILATLTCTRSDVLPAGHSYPSVTLKVDVSCNARARVSNTATVAGGGDTTTHTATDTTTIKHHGHDRDGHNGRHDHCDRHDH